MKSEMEPLGAGDIEGVEGLLEAGASLEGVNKAGRTALMVAAGRGNDAALRALLDAGRERVLY